MPKKRLERAINPKKWSEWALFRGMFREDPLYHENWTHPKAFFGGKNGEDPHFLLVYTMASLSLSIEIAM